VAILFRYIEVAASLAVTPHNTLSLRRSIIMRGRLGIASIAVVLGVLAFLSMDKAPDALAQRAKTDRIAVEYKVIALTYNPGERLTDEQRSAQFEKVLNTEAKAGWEPVTSLLTRNTVQTVGGGVTTRDSTSFVAFRRPR
jgi:hypothetical protein